MNGVLEAIRRDKQYAGIASITRGVEKESLRVCSGGNVANSTHPTRLGSALTHKNITTDASEALLEFVTSPSACANQTLQSLNDLHAFTYRHLGDEQLWVTSMPCSLDGVIPVAEYGVSNTGRMKSIYRKGLAQRYGRRLAIAGVHYNFSVSDELWLFLKDHRKSPLSLVDFKTEGYFNLSRNFLRNYWLLIYLFGASPSFCRSLLGKKDHCFSTMPHGQDTLFGEYATSLRMSDIGFKSGAQDSLSIHYNCLKSYVSRLCGAIARPHSDYVSKGIKNAAGEYIQLTDSLLQSESEFYSVIRPKRTAKKGESCLSALVNRGVEYVEVRCLDLNPYAPVGIDQQQMAFLDIFLLYCLLGSSPPLHTSEHKSIRKNQERVACQGRDPTLRLVYQGKERMMRAWAADIFSDLKDIADVLDQASLDGDGQKSYRDCLAGEFLKIEDSSLTPSEKMLADMKNNHQSFTEFGLQLAKERQQYFLRHCFDNLSEYQSEVQLSLDKQAEYEKQKGQSFDQYLKQYYAQYSQLETEFS